ncbi:hypothetical protein BM74_17590 [Bacillus thuringiensis]|uniref:NAD(+) hydrolase ThsA n=1 Tax=Bacillus thuringiensis TaxID=1428 RepID=A0A437SJ59_BACTU|nr:SIR2 family protein [Bacillus thuringiensis]RVU62977.1 hypothetical protein BM74_17590 [Bacillus thuringiensis]
MIVNKREKKNFVNSYVRALNNGRAAIFAGAGVSIPSGGISWSDLLREEAESIGLDISKENDLISVAQYIYNESGTKQTITSLLKNKIAREGKINKNHEIIRSLPIRKIWTTNYDDFLEKAYLDANKVIDVKKSIEDIATEIDFSETTIYKMHGDIGIPSSTVLLKDDYEIYDKKNELFTKTLQTDLLSNTFLFIGFSFDDPNLESILSKVRIMLEGNPRRHYCLLKKISKNDPEFDNFLGKTGNDALKQADKFCEKLGEALFTEGFEISSGFGLGVGRNVVTGVLIQESLLNHTRVGSQLVIRPFPTQQTIPEKRVYREKILSECGVTICVFGNKKISGGNELQDSPGVEEEAEIAGELGQLVLPIGSTGYVAKKVWEEQLGKITTTFSENPKILESYNNLNNPNQSIDQLIDDILIILKEYKINPEKFKRL